VRLSWRAAAFRATRQLPRRAVAPPAGVPVPAMSAAGLPRPQGPCEGPQTPVQENRLQASDTRRLLLPAQSCHPPAQV
jgi:hypothetical protein